MFRLDGVKFSKNAERVGFAQPFSPLLEDALLAAGRDVLTMQGVGQGGCAVFVNSDECNIVFDGPCALKLSNSNSRRRACAVVAEDIREDEAMMKIITGNRNRAR